MHMSFVNFRDFLSHHPWEYPKTIWSEKAICQPILTRKMREAIIFTRPRCVLSGVVQSIREHNFVRFSINAAIHTRKDYGFINVAQNAFVHQVWLTREWWLNSGSCSLQNNCGFTGIKTVSEVAQDAQLLEMKANDALASLIMMFGNPESCIAFANPLSDYKTMLLCDDVALSMPFRKRSSGTISCSAMNDRHNESDCFLTPTRSKCFLKVCTGHLL